MLVVEEVQEEEVVVVSQGEEDEVEGEEVQWVEEVLEVVSEVILEVDLEEEEATEEVVGWGDHWMKRRGRRHSIARRDRMDIGTDRAHWKRRFADNLIHKERAAMENIVSFTICVDSV
eukprot:348078_1